MQLIYHKNDRLSSQITTKRVDFFEKRCFELGCYCRYSVFRLCGSRKQAKDNMVGGILTAHEDPCRRILPGLPRQNNPCYPHFRPILQAESAWRTAVSWQPDLNKDDKNDSLFFVLPFMILKRIVFIRGKRRRSFRWKKQVSDIETLLWLTFGKTPKPGVRYGIERKDKSRNHPAIPVGGPDLHLHYPNPAYSVHFRLKSRRFAERRTLFTLSLLDNGVPAPVRCG